MSCGVCETKYLQRGRERRTESREERLSSFVEAERGTVGDCGAALGDFGAAGGGTFATEDIRVPSREVSEEIKGAKPVSGHA